MVEPVVRIEGMTKTFASLRGPVTAVRDLSMTVERGSVVAFVGPNGAGKTTTIYAMLGILRPTRGAITLFGEPAGGLAARRRLGFLSEIFYTYPYRTARGAMRFYGRLSGMSAGDLEERIPRHLARLGLGDAIDRRLGSYSKGMIQRLGLAQALLHEPELLILDEPTTGLDPEGRKLVADIIAEEKARGTTVFLSSHILSDVERICDRMVILRRGEAVLSDTIANLVAVSDHWEVEVTRWQPAFAPRVAEAASGIVRESGDAAVLRCPAERKDDLLRLLLQLGTAIGAVRPARRSLEDRYLELVGGTSSG